MVAVDLSYALRQPRFRPWRSLACATLRSLDAVGAGRQQGSSGGSRALFLPQQRQRSISDVGGAGRSFRDGSRRRGVP